ncbi:hypothetical protein ABI59_20190 [Acidobacteria bacterium Mor1]|nr:hypothetical protein ABI59_20190 [Acidobacteria bacterium Mor1]
MNDPLLSRVAQGDQAAVSAVLDRYGDLVWSLAHRFTRNRAEAEDAVQEIFIELWSNAGRYDENKASETTFVAMIARRRLIDRLRKSKRQPTTEELDKAVEVSEAPAGVAIETVDEAERAEKLMEELKPEQREAIRLSVYYGYSHQIISEKLGLPLGTVKTHIRRGLLRIRDAMTASRSGIGGEAMR